MEVSRATAVGINTNVHNGHKFVEVTYEVASQRKDNLRELVTVAVFDEPRVNMIPIMFAEDPDSLNTLMAKRESSSGYQWVMVTMDNETGEFVYLY